MYSSLDVQRRQRITLQRLIVLISTKNLVFKSPYYFVLSVGWSLAVELRTIRQGLSTYGHYVEDSAKYHLSSLLKCGATAILCGNDLLAVGVIKESARLNVKIPQELSVVGFDNLPIAEKITPALTTICQNRIAETPKDYFATFDCFDIYKKLGF